ncbi:hypothetical protein [Trichoplusia ni ascovirus 2c]|uniref:hypothetical protein n=1 Tax=Trichoplusia ni ascovirus 2c TaxID=328615 RepID=UPI0000E44241|nr:hypothetical protein TNAV2c_gp105 [Trichoplusia ni ascovirus 2c]ABF70622.1 hypothetical protein [Trichoplusia ni ascovirus 2c]
MSKETIIKVIGDGSCLFRTLSILLTNSTNDKYHKVIRDRIILYIVKNWSEFQTMTHDKNGDNYMSPMEYALEMKDVKCMGGIAEIVAASRIYPFKFVVIRNGETYVSTTNDDCPLRKILFTGNDLTNGHFDAILNNTDESTHSYFFSPYQRIMNNKNTVH